VPKSLPAAAILLLCASCVKHTPVPSPHDVPLATTVDIAPYDPVSPFLCRLTLADLTCMATTAVRFRRGQLETQIAAGDTFSFHTPRGQGTLAVWFGCAAANECGPGFFMAGGLANTASVVPVPPARYWNNAPNIFVPHGSLGIIEVDIRNDQFVTMRNRWSGTVAPPLVKAGAGLTVVCNELACTVSTK
jgi:hypothetical protein